MRSLRRSAAAGALVAGLAAVPAAPAQAAEPKGELRELAEEVCEDMVRDAVEAVADAPLALPQQGSWADRTYTCTYDVGDGQLVLSVEVLRSRAGARARYREARAAADVDQRLHGIGQQAFQATDGTLVARKDSFVLTVDPELVPARLDKADLAFAATTAVMTCWPGGEA
jgi:hypothetical protein